MHLRYQNNHAFPCLISSVFKFSTCRDQIKSCVQGRKDEQKVSIVFSILWYSMHHDAIFILELSENFLQYMVCLDPSNGHGPFLYSTQGSPATLWSPCIVILFPQGKACQWKCWPSKWEQLKSGLSVSQFHVAFRSSHVSSDYIGFVRRHLSSCLWLQTICLNPKICPLLYW